MIARTGGCASHWPTVDTKIAGAQAEIPLPPKQLLETAKRVVTSPPMSLKVEEEGKGSFLTSGQRFPGEWHVARRWQELTRYRVTVIPDFDNPSTHSRVEVRE